MENEIIMWVIGVGLGALIIGIIIGKSMSSDNSSSVSKAEKELEEYKSAVSEHFGKTADLVDNLTSSYKDVFEHLGNSAKQLLSEEEVNKHLDSRAEKAVTLTYIKSEENQLEKDNAKTETAAKNNTEAEESKEKNPESDDKPAQHDDEKDNGESTEDLNKEKEPANSTN